MLKNLFTYLTIFSLMTSQLYAIETPGYTEVELSNPISASPSLAKMEAGEGAKEKSTQHVSPHDEDKGVRKALLPKQYAEGNDRFAAKIVILLAALGGTLYYLFIQTSGSFNHTQAAGPTPDPVSNFGPGGWWGR
jgi:hypothetical protein